MSETLKAELPLTLNSTYNIVVCSSCSIGLPWEWISGHMRDNHGIKISIEDVREFLQVDGSAMTVTDAKDWLAETWFIPSLIPNLYAKRNSRGSYEL